MADERFVVQYKKKEEKCKKWKDFIDIKKSIVFCSALGGILGALVGMPAGGAVCGGVMGTNAQDGLKSLVDWFIGPSEDDKKKYEFYKQYEKTYLLYAKEYAGKNNVEVDFNKSEGKLLLEIQKEIESCYNSYCNLNEDDTDIGMDEIINKNIKQQHQEFKNLSERNLLDSIGDACKDMFKNVSNALFNTGKGKVVNSLKQIVPNKHISHDMDQKDKNFMRDLYEKIRHKQEIKINFVDKCSPEQNNENSNTKSDTLYLSREMFKKVYKVFTNTKFEKEKMPTKDNLDLFYQTNKLLFGDLFDKNFKKDFLKKDFSLEKDFFSLKAMPQMKWKVKKMTVNGKPCTMKNEQPCTTKTLEYFFADISKHIQRNQGECLIGNTKSTREKTNAISQYDKAKKESNNSSSSINTSITSRKSSEASKK